MSKSGLNGVEAVDAEAVGDDGAGRAAAIDRVRGAMALKMEEREVDEAEVDASVPFFFSFTKRDEAFLSTEIVDGVRRFRRCRWCMAAVLCDRRPLPFVLYTTIMLLSSAKV